MDETAVIPKSPNMSEDDQVKKIITRNAQLKGERATWDSLWQNIANYCQPRKNNITKKNDYPTSADETILYDSTAVRANITLANGLVAWICPADSPWFSYDPPENLTKSDPAAQWYAECTKIARGVLARSNFYGEIHENFLNDCFGTSCLYWEVGKNSPIVYTALSVGTYSLAMDDEGNIDTLYREIKLTPRQAELKYGRENLSEKLQKALDTEDKTGKSNETVFEFIQAIYPREDKYRDTEKKDGRNKPWASCHVEVGGKKLVRESGYDLKPFAASRFLKWGDFVYGWGPGVMALPDARQVNFLTKQMDALAETKAFPRMLLPDTMEGEVDIAAGGVTFFDPNQPNALPKEWITSGDYNIGLQREQEKKQAIERAFMSDMFQMLANQEKTMTAREVAERVAEKFTQFTPAFARKTTELLNPMMDSLFQILARSGAFPSPPQEAFIQTNDGFFLGTPSTVFNSRISLVVKAQDNIAFQRQLEMIEPLVQFKPELLDQYDWTTIARDTARNNGLPPDWILPEEEVQQIAQQRAQAQQQAQQMKQAEVMGKTAKDMGSVKPDSVVGQAITNSQGKKPQAVPGVPQ